jgi:general secretion pathway protein G
VVAVRIQNRKAKGFTLIELLLVLVIIAVIAAIAAPILTGSIDQGKEAALKENLYVMRKAVDDYYADKGHYPAQLQDLVDKRYIRAVPKDPITDSKATWVLEKKSVKDVEGIWNVRSGAPGKDREGTLYANW